MAPSRSPLPSSSSSSRPHQTPPHSPPSPSSPPSHSHSTPHTTYQSFADLPPSPVTPSAPYARRYTGRRGDVEPAPFSPSSPADADASPPLSFDGDDEGARGTGKSGGGPSSGNEGKNGKGKKKTTLSTAELIKMTVGIAGAQLAWTVEMAYGTPYLLSLGLSKQGTSLVWMAGPLSGLVVQPVVGALSDSSPSRYRRRFYILLSALLILLSTLVVAYAQPLASLLTSLLPFGWGGMGDWDPEKGEVAAKVAIGLGVGGFYALDFALNGLQASLRALVLDLSPPGLHSLSNAYLGRQTHVANIAGYVLGYSDLSHSPLLRWIGGGQFRKLALVACAGMAACVGVTCATQEEERRVARERREGDEGEEAEEDEGAWKKLKGVVRDVGRNLRDLPRPVRRVCYVQFFNWTAWFPFLFYSTTYVSESLYASSPPSSSPSRPPPSSDEATRLGSLALLAYALVSLASSILLPWLTTLCTSYPSLPRRAGPLGREVLSRVTPRNCWTAALVWYAALMASTFWVRGVKGAMAVVALAGVPWAVTCWVPFALVMESIRDLETEYDAASAAAAESTALTSPSPADDPFYSPRRLPSRDFRTPFRAAAASSLRQASFTVPVTAASSSRGSSAAASPARGGGGGGGATERTALLGANGKGAGGGDGPKRQRPSGGTLLGIHNLSIVLPQFFVALVAAIIFHFTSSPPAPPASPTSPSPSSLFSPLSILSNISTSAAGAPAAAQTNDVVHVLRFGGLFALLGAFVSASGSSRRRSGSSGAKWWGGWGLCETGSERAYRWWVLEGWREAEAEAAEEERRAREGGSDSGSGSEA
ncbi:hypothetical protein JCM6882_003831 [Rhodosporidiobolus microsporus]